MKKDPRVTSLNWKLTAVWLSKMDLLNAVATLNPFGTEYFWWCVPLIRLCGRLTGSSAGPTLACSAARRRRNQRTPKRPRGHTAKFSRADVPDSKGAAGR